MNVNARKLKKIGENIKKIRKQRGLTQEQLADKIRVTTTYIGFIEQAQRNPSIKTADKIARVLKVGIDELFK
jgi:transcriptional regulator with XRE-family HTH domain